MRISAYEAPRDFAVPKATSASDLRSSLAMNPKCSTVFVFASRTSLSKYSAKNLEAVVATATWDGSMMITNGKR